VLLARAGNCDGINAQGLATPWQGALRLKGRSRSAAVAHAPRNRGFALDPLLGRSEGGTEYRLTRVA